MCVFTCAHICVCVCALLRRSMHTHTGRRGPCPFFYALNLTAPYLTAPPRTGTGTGTDRPTPCTTTTTQHKHQDNRTDTPHPDRGTREPSGGRAREKRRQVIHMSTVLAYLIIAHKRIEYRPPDRERWAHIERAEREHRGERERKGRGRREKEKGEREDSRSTLPATRTVHSASTPRKPHSDAPDTAQAPHSALIPTLDRPKTPYTHPKARGPALLSL